jgi:hypothetical protein
LAVLIAFAGCGFQVRGGTHGYTFSPISKYPLSTRSHHEKLSSSGARVAVAREPTPGCDLVGEVTGTAGPAPDALLGESPEQIEARLPWDEATAASRNRAASAGATELVVDAFAVIEHHQIYPHGVFAAVYGRAFRCPRR